MQPDQVRFLVQQVSCGTIFGDECYDLERGARCQQYGTQYDPLLRRAGGVYVIRAKGDPLWAYVGQTKKFAVRLQHLQGVFTANEMPFTDPHKASPPLWAWMQNQPIELEVLVLPLQEDSAYWRQGMEHFIIAFHRWQFGCSPRWQFSRMPRGWSPSTNRKRGIRGRNIPEEVVLNCHQPGLVPITKLFEDHSDPLSESWASHRWSPWYSSVKDLPPVRPGPRGLYRLERGGQFLFLGIYGVRRDEMDEEEETEILSIAGAKKRSGAMSLERIFQDAARQGARCSFASGTWPGHQLRELWTDALALYLRQQFALPPAQFGGSEERRPLPNLQETMRYLCKRLSPMTSRWSFPLAS